MNYQNHTVPYFASGKFDKRLWFKTFGVVFVLSFLGLSMYTREKIKTLKNSDYAEYLAEREARRVIDQQLKR